MADLHTDLRKAFEQFIATLRTIKKGESPYVTEAYFNLHKLSVDHVSGLIKTKRMMSIESGAIEVNADELSAEVARVIIDEVKVSTTFHQFLDLLDAIAESFTVPDEDEGVL